MKAMRPKAGFTLIEVILTMVILSISLTSLSILVINVVRQNVLSQAQATSASLAEKETERLTNMRFSSVTTQAQTGFPAPFSAYSYEVIVDYVNAGDLNTPVAGPTDYKRARIIVTNDISGAITLTTLVTNDW